jgi:hypothetical protein
VLAASAQLSAETVVSAQARDYLLDEQGDLRFQIGCVPDVVVSAMSGNVCPGRPASG